MQKILSSTSVKAMPPREHRSQIHRIIWLGQKKFIITFTMSHSYYIIFHEIIFTFSKCFVKYYIKTDIYTYINIYLHMYHIYVILIIHIYIHTQSTPKIYFLCTMLSIQIFLDFQTLLLRNRYIYHYFKC